MIDEAGEEGMSALSDAGIRRVVVCGHSGFIGGAVHRRLQVEAPEIELVGLSLREMDLTDPDQTRQLGTLLDRDTALVMCSAIKRQSGDSVESYDRNMRMTVNLARVIVDRPIRRLVYMSSAAVYGEDIENRAITEDTPPQIRSYYGLAKLSAELLLRKVTASAGESGLVCLRPPTVYGPGELEPSYGVGSFLRAACAGRGITLWGDGSELREMIFVEDLATVILRLLPSGFGGVLNVAAGRSYSFRQALDAVIGTVPRKVEVTSRPRSKQKVDNGFDNARLRSLLPELRFTRLEEGVRLNYEVEYAGSAAQEGI
jgi:UDP-glucose 4-epimerase